MKYLVVFGVYRGTHYCGEFTQVFDTYKNMIKNVKEESLSLKVKRVYVIEKELNVEEL